MMQNLLTSEADNASEIKNIPATAGVLPLLAMGIIAVGFLITAGAHPHTGAPVRTPTTSSVIDSTVSLAPRASFTLVSTIAPAPTDPTTAAPPEVPETAPETRATSTEAPPPPDTATEIVRAPIPPKVTDTVSAAPGQIPPSAPPVTP